MGRKKPKQSSSGFLIVVGLVIGLPLWVMSKVVSGVGALGAVLLIILPMAGFVYLRSRRSAQRRASLLVKYGDQQIVEKIMGRRFWEGQTHQQLVDSIGNPAAVDDQLLKTKKRQVWKYQQTGRNRYNLRLILENDIVVGWTNRA